MVLEILSYLATAWVLLTYWLMVTKGKMKWFNLANAVGSVPLVLVQLQAGTYAPAILTAAFGIIGLIGLIRDA